MGIADIAVLLTLVLIELSIAQRRRAVIRRRLGINRKG